MEKEILSIKEYAQITGVSEQAVYKRLRNKNSELQEFLVIENEKKFLKKEVLELAKRKPEARESKKQTEEATASELQHLQEMVDILKGQLEKADKELEVKNNQIESLNSHIESLNKQNEQLTEVIRTTSESLKAEQFLHADTKNLIGETSVTEENKAPEEPKEKKGFFSKLFG